MKRYGIAVWTVGLVAAGLAAPRQLASAEPPRVPPPRVPPSPSEFHAVRLDGSSIRLDGIPDEPIWQQGTAITGLTSYDPVEGGAPVGQMTAWVFYDASALYVAARIDLPPGILRGRLAARERWNNDDLFELMLDPFLDRRTGYDFAINPFNVQIDYTIVDDEFSSAWDGVWDSAVARDDHGFSLEYRIPFRTLRFSSAEVQDWGIGLGFFSGFKKQFDKWPAISTDRGTLFQQLGVMRGITGIQPSHNLDVVPTVTTGYGGGLDPSGRFAWDKPTLFRARDPALIDVGIDARYALSSAANINVALNPDFSQVEADADQLVYNLRFPILLDEKRSFFLEGVSIFSTPVPLLYTRSIVDPIAGLKLSGRDDHWSFGLLSAYDQLPVGSRLTEATRRSGFEDASDKDAVNTIGRVSYDLGPASHVGVFVADKRLIDRGTGSITAHNEFAAADAILTIADIYTLIGQVTGSYLQHDAIAAALPGEMPSAADSYAGLSYSLTARRHDKHLLLELHSDYESNGFRAETGPMTRVDIMPSSLTTAYRINTGSDLLPVIAPELTLSTIHDARSHDLLDDTVRPALEARLGGNTDLALFYSHGQETFNHERFRGIDLVGTKISTYPWNFLSAALDLQAGDQINYDPADPFLGTAVQGSLDVMVKPLRNAEIELRYTKSRLFRPGGALRADVDLYYSKISATFTTQLSLRVITQLDTFLDQLSNSVLLAYQIHPGTEGYLGYQELDLVGDSSHPIDRRAFLKLSYRWQL
jgi:hypothetical protein